MSSSLLQRIWNRIRNPTYCIGRDLEGNKYFEYPNPNDKFGRTKRVVKYRNGYDMWTYIANSKRLPVQWSSWLTHTRNHPPTLEELQTDLLRQKHMKLRVAMLNAAERDALAASAISGPVDSHNMPATHNVPSSQASADADRLISPGTDAKRNDTRGSALGSTDTTSDEPEPWIPRVAHRQNR